MNGPEAVATPVLSIEGLTVRYGRTTAVEDLTFHVPAGRVYALLGRNGAGKTSVVRCLLGQLKPASGRIALFGRDAWRERRALMEKVGIVPEEPDAPPDMTARQLAGFCRGLYATWDDAAFGARLQRFEVPLDVPFGRLSKGQKGAVMLGLALAPMPPLLILDDPTLGLDVLARRSFFEELIGELADRGTTVFITTHDLAGIAGIADQVGILRGTRLIVNEDVQALKSRFRRIRWGGPGAGGTGLWNGFELVQVGARGWGNEAVVANFQDERFDAFLKTEGVTDAEAASLPLEEIFTAVVAAGKEERP
jgi:ABC-type multidrug transport system ATPase subunit